MDVCRHPCHRHPIISICLLELPSFLQDLYGPGTGHDERKLCLTYTTTEATLVLLSVEQQQSRSLRRRRFESKNNTAETSPDRYDENDSSM